MCDYSLEMYKSRPARADEELTVKKFPSSSRGFVDPVDTDCAVCLESGVELILHLDTAFEWNASNLEDNTYEKVTLSGDVSVVFHEIKSYMYHDGFKLPNGLFLILQALPDGTRATVTKPLPVEIAEAASAPVAFDPDEKIVTAEVETV